MLYANGLYLEVVIANLFLRKPLVEKIVGDWAWERATNNGWVKDTFEEFQTRWYGLKVNFWQALRSFCVRQADAVIVPSKFLARAVAGWGVARDKTQRHLQCGRVAFSHNSHRIANDAIQHCNSGAVGSMETDRSFDQRARRDQDAGLVVIGDGPERRRLEKLAETNQVTDRVYFAGQKSKAETFGLMAACDLFVLNSTYEGFPHVVLEAMSAGLPVVGTAVGGTPELVHDGENGVLIAANANGALSKTLIRLLVSSEERQRLAVGAEKTTEQFQRSVMIDATEAALRAFA